MLLEADPYILIEGSVTDSHPTGHYRISESAFDAQALSQLDDSILKVIRLSNEPGLARAKHILNRIDRRDLVWQTHSPIVAVAAIYLIDLFSWDSFYEQHIVLQ